MCFDPSAKYETKGCFLIKKDILEKFLKENKLRLIWSIRGEKIIIGGRDHNNDFYKSFTPYRKFSGFYYLEDGQIKGNTWTVSDE